MFYYYVKYTVTANNSPVPIQVWIKTMLNYFILFRKSICQYRWLCLFAGDAQTQPCFPTSSWAEEWNRLCVCILCLHFKHLKQATFHHIKWTSLLQCWHTAFANCFIGLLSLAYIQTVIHFDCSLVFSNYSLNTYLM